MEDLGEWPKLAGKVEGKVDPRSGFGGRLIPAKSMEGLMAALDSYLKTKQQRLQDVGTIP